MLRRASCRTSPFRLGSRPIITLLHLGMAQDRNGAAKTSRGIASAIERALFLLGLLVIVFVGGIAVGRYDLPPAPVLNAAVDAARDWLENWRNYFGLRSKWRVSNHRGAGVTRHDPERAYRGYTFLTMYRDGLVRPYLIDMEGRIRHRWPLDLPAIWKAAGYDRDPMPVSDFSIHGAQLVENGDVVLNLSAAALVRLDRCGRVVWAARFGAHHDVERIPGGGWVAPGRRVIDKAPDPDLWYLRPDANGQFKVDTIVLVDDDGNIVDERPLIELFKNSDLHALLVRNGSSSLANSAFDPLHFNDIEPVTPDIADAFPSFDAGDWLLSLRNLNAVVVVDAGFSRIKWWRIGPFLRQHDPQLLPNGHILVFDNRLTGRKPRLGYSRIIELDPVSWDIVWSYTGTDEDPFYSHIGGKLQLLPNGNILAVEPQGGRVFELTHDTRPEIVWEYVNDLGDGDAGYIFDAQRVPSAALTFLDRPCP